MAYTVYQTKAIVCGSYARAGADKDFRLFTKEAGVLFARARSVREERSKQRFALQDFSLVDVSLVRGKAGWRIGSVTASKNLFSDASTREARGLIVGGVKLLNRFLQGEEPHQDVFDEAEKYFEFVLESGETDITHTYVLFELRLLHLLGYVRETPSLQTVLEMHIPYENLMSFSIDDIELEINRAVKEAYEVSHL